MANVEGPPRKPAASAQTNATREVAREEADDRIDEMLRHVWRVDRHVVDPEVPPPHQALAFTRRMMARNTLLRKWWGWLVLGIASLVLSTAGGDLVKWAMKKMALFP